MSDRSNLKYLTEEETVPLQTGLLYGGQSLLVREDYNVTYNDILSYKHEIPMTRGIVVAGQPGIGMYVLSAAVYLANNLSI